MSSTPPSTYWLDTRRPAVNLVFLLPLLLVYELGVLALSDGHRTPRNGADEWLRAALASGSPLLPWCLPVILIGVLVAWQNWLNQSWNVRIETLAGMAAESLMFACLLILVGQAADGWMKSGSPSLLPESCVLASLAGTRLVHFLGAGIYEEFLFRLCLLPVGYLVLRALLLPHRWSIAGAVISSSVIFALAHYLSPTADATLLSVFSEAVTRVQSSRELWFGFVFRLIAGVWFALLFQWRGFGIAVGCHAAYDVVVGIVLISEL